MGLSYVGTGDKTVGQIADVKATLHIFFDAVCREDFKQANVVECARWKDR